MAKDDEKKYFQLIGPEGVVFSVGKPFSDRVNAGSLLHNMAAVLTLLSGHSGESRGKVLDLGCGTGWTSYMIGRAGYEVVGVDISPEAITAAEGFYGSEKVSFEVSDYDNMAWAERFEAVVFMDSLHHTDDVLQTLRSALKAVKPGGICVICEPGKGHSRAPDAIEAVEKYGVTERDMPPSLVKRLAKEAGWHRAEVYPHPSLLHRAAYMPMTGSSRKARLLRLPGVRGLALQFIGSLKCRDEGIVVLYR